MRYNFNIPTELLDLIKSTLAEKYHLIQNDITLDNIVKIIDDWKIGYDKRLSASFEDKYTQFKNKIKIVFNLLKLNQTIKPTYKDYDSIIIFGSTGPCHYQIWNDLIKFHIEDHIQFKRIFLLGGDRKIHPIYDNLDLTYKYHSQDFKRILNFNEILEAKNEMGLMELISSAIKIPKSMSDIPVISIYTEGHIDNEDRFVQADTKDTIIKLIESYKLPEDKPLLFLNSLPYIKRQGLQAKFYLPDYMIDIAAYTHFYLETIDTPLKGELPTALYMDELYWYLDMLNKYYSNLT